MLELIELDKLTATTRDESPSWISATQTNPSVPSDSVTRTRKPSGAGLNPFPVNSDSIANRICEVAEKPSEEIFFTSIEIWREVPAAAAIFSASARTASFHFGGSRFCAAEAD
jgi:hypothetical protein